MVSKRIGEVVGEDMTKYILSPNKHSPHPPCGNHVDSHNFLLVSQLVTLGSNNNIKNNVMLETQKLSFQIDAFSDWVGNWKVEN